jgi:PhnB protein
MTHDATHDLTTEFPGITPQLTVTDTDAAVAFYRAAFGADELLRNSGPDGRVFHCELLVNGGRLLVHDDFSEHGEDPSALGGSPVVLHLYVPDVDAAFAAAVAAGATPVAEPQDAFWGDRYAQLTDPFGHRWSLGTTREEQSVAEQEAAADDWSRR